MTRAARRFASTVAFVALAAHGAALADGLALADSPAVRCLTPAADVRGTPEYPLQLFKDGKGGKVDVELIFTTTDKRPEVKVLSSEGADSLVDAVKDHVREFRVPCLAAADIPVRLRQQYIFQSDKSRVTWTAPADQADPDRRSMMACVTHVRPGEKPRYPHQALHEGQSGRVLVLLRFVAADQAPQVTTFDNGFTRTLSSDAADWAAGFRMPCHQGAPVEASWVFDYRLAGVPAAGFRDVTLRNFVGGIKDIRGQRVFFDFNAMGCPFDVKLVYMQPHLPNKVGDLEAPRPERTAFYEWLSRAVLDLSPRQHAAVIGDSVTLAIPCTKIDITPDPAPAPKEKTS